MVDLVNITNRASEGSSWTIMLGAKRPQIIAGLIKLGGQVSNDIVRDLQGYCLPLSTLWLELRAGVLKWFGLKAIELIVLLLLWS